MDGANTNHASAYDAFQQQIGQGYDLLRLGRFDDAIQFADKLLESYPGNAEALYLASETRLEAGDPESALTMISAAVEAAPGQVELLLKKARNLLLLRRRADARRVVTDAAVVAGNDGRGLAAVAGVYTRCGDPVSACGLYEKALASGYRTPALLYDLAAVQFFTGDFARAEENLNAILIDAPDVGQVYYLRSTLRRQTTEDNHVAELESRLKAGFPDDAGRAACLYALAKELEDLGRVDASFAALTEGAALKRQTLRYDAAAERATIEAVATAYTEQALQTQVAGHDEAGAIFIVGMPRTGTTLVERMLGRHHDVVSANELPDFGQLLATATQKAMAAHPEKSPAEASLMIDFVALGREYMRGAREAASGSRVFVDKMPINYMYCGLIRKALPNARLIHMTRDPVDTCYAIYKTLFSQAYPFSYDLDELGAYFGTYHHLMRHWHAVMPGEILDVGYEDLVANTPDEARRILEWCGLDWQAEVLVPSENDNPSMTASAAQVREPVHARSVGAWRSHEEGLAPLVASLITAGCVVPRT